MKVSIFAILIVLTFFTHAVHAEGDACIRLLSGRLAKVFNAPVMGDPDYPNYIEAIEKLFDTLTEKEVDFVKLEKVLRASWLVTGPFEKAMSTLSVDKIRSAFPNSTPFVQFTHDFFTQVASKLSDQPELAQQIRFSALELLSQQREAVEQAREEEQLETQKHRIIDPRFEPTSTGSVFKSVKHPTFRDAVQDPDGVIWSEVLIGKYRNYGTHKGEVITLSDAVKACDELGGRLPTLEDYTRFQSYFDFENNKMTAEGLNDLYRIFPDMKPVMKPVMIDKYFWSSSVYRNSEGRTAQVFSSYHGRLGVDACVNANFVRCVAR